MSIPRTTLIAAVEEALAYSELSEADAARILDTARTTPVIGGNYDTDPACLVIQAGWERPVPDELHDFACRFDGALFRRAGFGIGTHHIED